MSDARWRARVLLGCGALVGVAIAVRGAVHTEGGARALPSNAVALVGATVIGRDEFTRALAAVQADRREGSADASLRRHVLSRLVDEALLIDGAIELGLPTRDPRVRGQLASAMLETVVEGASSPPSDSTLRAFHASHAASFTRRGRVRIEALFFRGPEAGDRAEVAAARLRVGEAFSSVARDADEPPLPVPTGFVSITKLADYVGPTAAAAVDALPEGGLAPRLDGSSGVWSVHVLGRQGGALAPYDEVRAEVLAEYEREADDRRLRTWLDRRRESTRVVVREADL